MNNEARTPSFSYGEVQQIYNVEEEIVWAIDGYRELIQETYKIATKITISVLSDGDVNTPVTITHRLVLDIDWKKL